MVAFTDYFSYLRKFGNQYKNTGYYKPRDPNSAYDGAFSYLYIQNTSGGREISDPS